MNYSKLINGEAAFTELADVWDSLAQQSITDTPFQTLAYQQSWWTHLHPTDATLHVVSVYNKDDALIGIASFYINDNVIYFNGCVEETDYLDLIVREEDAESVWTAVLDCLCSSGFPQWESMNLCNIPAASPSRKILSQEAEKRGFSLQEIVMEVCPIIELPSTFEEYLANINSKQRREIKRKLRRANGAGVELVAVQPGDDIAQHVDSFLQLLQQSTLEKQAWLNDNRRTLFHDVARTALEAGTLQLLFLEVDGRQAATLFNLDYKGRTWVYNSGLHAHTFSNLSLGVVITAKAIELAIENGNTTFDFLRGNETYKYRFGAKDTQIFGLTIQRDA